MSITNGEAASKDANIANDKNETRVAIETDDAELNDLLTMWLSDAGYEIADGGLRIIDTETRGDGAGDDGSLYLVYGKKGHKFELERPFTHSELTAAVRTLGGEPESELVCDPTSRRVCFRGDSASLTNKEYEIMRLLCERGEAGVTRDEISAIARRRGGEIETNAADVYICHLRRKLRDLTGAPVIKTLRGRGYSIS